MADNQEFYRLKLVLSMQDRLTARLKKIDEGVVKFEERMAKTQAVMDKFSNTKVEPRITLDTSTIEDRLNKTNELLEKIAKKTVEPKIKPKDETERTTSKVEGRLQKLTAKTWDITIKLKDKTISGLDKINNALTSPLGILGVGAGAVGIGGLITNSAQKSMDFTAEISNIKALTGIQGEELDSVRKRALELGKTTQFSALEAAKGMTELLKAGINVKDVMGEASKAALDLASAGDLSLPEAAEIMSTSMNAFKMNDPTKVANLLAGAANASATDVHEMKYALSQVSNVAGGKGLTMDDVSVGLALFAQNNLKGSDAGTSMKTMLERLIPKTKPAIEAFEKLGLLEADGGSAFYDAQGNIKSIEEIADLLHNSMKDLTKEQQASLLDDMFGSDAIRGGTVLIREGAEGIRKMRQEMTKFTASQVAQEKWNNALGSIVRLKSAFDTFQIEALHPIEPAITKISNAFTDFFSNAERLETIKSTVAGISDEIVTFMDNLASDEKFQNMQWGDKIVFLLDQMMIKMDEWASGSGGEQFGKVMTKLAEIGIKAFVGALTGMIKAAFNSAIEGNFSSAISLGLGSAFMASILPLSGIFKIVKNTIDFGKNIKTGSYWLGDAYSSGTSTTSKILKKIPVIGARFDGYRFLTSDDKAKTGTEIIGGWGGAWAGSKIGAGIGGAIGSIIPGVGTAIGAGVGSVFGGVGGYWLGSNTVSSIIDPQNNSFMNEHGQSQIQNSNMQLETAKAQSAMMNEILESAGEKINRLKELGAEGWNSLGENASMNLERMRYGLSSARESILQATNTISEDFGEMSNSISEWCSTIVTDVTSWFAQIPDRVGQAIDEAVARANAGLSDLKISAWNALPAPLRDTIDWGAKKLGIKGYANGGFLNQDQIIRVAEGNNAEVIIPLHSSKRQRGLSLWQQAGQMLGVNSNLFTNVTNNNYMPAMAYALSSGNTSDNGKSNNSNNAFSFNGLNIHIGNNKSDDEMASAIGWKILAEVKQAYQNRG